MFCLKVFSSLCILKLLDCVLAISLKIFEKSGKQDCKAFSYICVIFESLFKLKRTYDLATLKICTIFLSDQDITKKAFITVSDILHQKYPAIRQLFQIKIYVSSSFTKEPRQFATFVFVRIAGGRNNRKPCKFCNSEGGVFPTKRKMPQTLSYQND